MNLEQIKDLLASGLISKKEANTMIDNLNYMNDIEFVHHL
jgi:hypothetical protein